MWTRIIGRATSCRNGYTYCILICSRVIVKCHQASWEAYFKDNQAWSCCYQGSCLCKKLGFVFCFQKGCWAWPQVMSVSAKATALDLSSTEMPLKIHHTERNSSLTGFKAEKKRARICIVCGSSFMHFFSSSARQYGRHYHHQSFQKAYWISSSRAGPGKYSSCSCFSAKLSHFSGAATARDILLSACLPCLHIEKQAHIRR